jgi:ethanolamine ammonia-lyase large subunit
VPYVRALPLKLAQQRRRVDERALLRALVDEEVERIDGFEIDDQIDVDRELFGALGYHDARQKISLRILRPIQEMVARLDAQGITEHGRARVRSRSQPHHLRAKERRRGVAVAGLVG